MTTFCEFTQSPGESFPSDNVRLYDGRSHFKRGFAVSARNGTKSCHVKMAFYDQKLPPREFFSLRNG